MNRCTRGLLALLGAAALFATPSSAQAQFFNFAPNANPRGFFNPYGFNYYGQAGGFLLGASSVIDASGQLQVTTQQARLMQQQVQQERIRTQRQAFDEFRYEQMLTPTLEEQRQFERQQELRRSQNDPPLTEIWSGKALNDLLLDLQKLQSQGGYSPSMPLDPATLRRINVTNNTTQSGNSQIVREGRARWPLPLQAGSFQPQREKIDKLLPEAVRQAKGGEVEGDTLNDLIAAIRGLNNNLRSQVADIPSNEYVRAMRFVRELQDATRVLQDPNVANYFTKWTAQGNDVAALVRHMTSNGLRFAPAGQGDQAEYTALHRAMATYNVALSIQVRGPQASATVQGRLITPAPSQLNP